MALTSVPERSPLRILLIILAVFVLPLALGLFFAPKIIPKPQIGIIRLGGEINGFSAFQVLEQFAYARDNQEVKAVLLMINSPGGLATASEELYLGILNARQEMPVVSSVDAVAGSGGYYAAAATNEIYAKPASVVGSVGVITFFAWSSVP